MCFAHFCHVGLISFFSQLLDLGSFSRVLFVWQRSMCCLCLDMCNTVRRYYKPSFPFRTKKEKTKQVNWNDLNCTGCRGPLISMLFLPSVNFDYGEMPVMALVSFLSFCRSHWLRGVGGVEVLIGNCRAHCLQIHGFSDWPASGSETHQLLRTHTCKQPHTHM